MNCVHILLEKNPFLVIMKNNSGETPIDYAVKFHSSGPDDRYVCEMENEVYHVIVERDLVHFSNQDYHTEAKKMYKYSWSTNHIS